MNRDDIIRMARESEWLGPYESPTGFSAEAAIKFAALVAAAEREACAKVVDENAAGCLGLLKHVLKANANAIRLRGNDD
jgi:hypothetical protein